MVDASAAVNNYGERYYLLMIIYGFPRHSTVELIVVRNTGHVAYYLGFANGLHTSNLRYSTFGFVGACSFKTISYYSKEKSVTFACIKSCVKPIPEASGLLSPTNQQLDRSNNIAVQTSISPTENREECKNISRTCLLLHNIPRLIQTITHYLARPSPAFIFYAMGDPFSAESNVVSLATFALQTTANLYSIVCSFRSQDKEARSLKAELNELNVVLESLVETATNHPEFNFEALRLPLHRCGKTCEEYGELIARFTGHSTGSGPSIRDWITQKYLQGGINDFKFMLASYKSTINIALANANIRVAAITPRVVEDYKDMVADTTSDLQAHLQRLDEQIQSLTNGNPKTDPDAEETTEWYAMLEERACTQQGLKLCAQISTPIEQLESKSKEASDFSNRPPIHQHIGSGLNAADGSIHTFMNRLQSDQDDIDRQLEAMQSTLPLPENATTKLSQLQQTRDSLSQCIKDLSDAGDTLADERRNAFEDIGVADDIHNITVSTVGDLVTARRLVLTGRSRHVGGQLSEQNYQSTIESLTQLDMEHIRSPQQYEQGPGQTSPITRSENPRNEVRARQYPLSNREISLPKVEANEPDVTDVLSDISEISDGGSIFTKCTNDTTQSSLLDMAHDPLQIAAQTLAHHLFQDPDLQLWYLQAVGEFGTVRFSVKHDKLLMLFLKELQELATDPVLKQAVSLFGRKQTQKRVTAHILRLIELNSNPSQENREAFERLLNQQEDRDYRLNLMFSQQFGTSSINFPETGSGAVRREGIEQDSHESGDSEDDDNDDEDLNKESDYQANRPGELGQLETVVKFVTTGLPFENFKSNFACFTNPPMTIPMALEAGNLGALQQLLRKRFYDVTEGEYAWLRELEDVGHTRDEIAQLLFEEASDSPWIFFTRPLRPIADCAVDIQHHLPGCVHSLDMDKPQPAASSGLAPERGDFTLIMTEIQGLCGLAGVAPSTRDLESWNGSVTFDKDNTIAAVSYAHLDTSKVIDRVLNSLELLCRALSQAQSANICCESFTILRKAPGLDCKPDGNGPLIEVYRIYFSIATEMVEELKPHHLDRGIRSLNVPAAVRLFKSVFPGVEHVEFLQKTDPNTVLHLCCLSAQLLCMGFQSYIQGHVGDFHPFFLDTPIKEIRLLGCYTTTGQYPCIEISFEELTCVGKMLQGPVLVFSTFYLQENTANVWKSPELARLDLLASFNDLIDTWGPGQFIGPSIKGKPSAIRIRGGIIHASDVDSKKFHWSRNATADEFRQGELDPAVKVTIGSPVIVNETCQLDETKCRTQCSRMLNSLGACSPAWVLEQIEVGFQTGMHILFQANAGYRLSPGRSLKKSRLESQPIDEVFSFLEDRWGVQVSLCTGVARRVSLREMVADLLPVFTSGFRSGEDCASWETLKQDHGIFEAFQKDSAGFVAWLRGLERRLHEFVVNIVCRILVSQCQTGLDLEGHSLLIAWPYGSETYKCFKIDLKQRESSWARLIADSDDCATFAYATPKCLETAEIRCRGAGELWRNTIPLLETTVMVYSTATVVNTVLQHKAKYYFKKFENLFVVQADRPDAAGVTKLVVKPSIIPVKYKKRASFLFKDTIRLREWGGLSDPAENVAIFTSSPN